MNYLLIFANQSFWQLNYHAQPECIILWPIQLLKSNCTALNLAELVNTETSHRWGFRSLKFKGWSTLKATNKVAAVVG